MTPAADSTASGSTAADAATAAARAASAASAVAPTTVPLRARAALAALTVARVLAAAVMLTLLLGMAAGSLTKTSAAQRSSGELLLAGGVVAAALLGSATTGGVLVAASTARSTTHPLQLWQSLTTRPLRSLALAAAALSQPHVLLEAYRAPLRRDRAAGVTMVVGPAAARLAVLRQLTLACLLGVHLPLLAYAIAYVAFARDVTRLSGLEFVPDNGAEVEGGILVAASALTLLLALTADAVVALVASRHSLRGRLFARSSPAPAAAVVERSPLHLLAVTGGGGIGGKRVQVTDYAAPAAAATAAGAAISDVATASPVFAARASGAAASAARPGAPQPTRALVVAQQLQLQQQQLT